MMYDVRSKNASTFAAGAEGLRGTFMQAGGELQRTFVMKWSRTDHAF